MAQDELTIVDVQNACKDVISAWEHVLDTITASNSPYETSQALKGAGREIIQFAETWENFCDPMMG